MSIKKTSILFLFLVVPAAAQERYFYTGKNYGSEALYNPISLILNGSFDIMQLDGYAKNIFSYEYYRNGKKVFRILGNPIPQISRVGWGTYIAHELLPFAWNREGAQWWPNYQLHLIGGGMTYVAMREWYEEYHFPNPTLLSITTMGVYHLLNEIVENDDYLDDGVDPIADIYLFDIGGIVLFSFDGVSKFFSEELHLADWSLQPSFSLQDYTLRNNGQYFSVKWKLPFSEQWHLFYYFGMNGLLGLSCKMNDGSAISFGAGLRAKRHEPTVGTEQTVALVWNAGVFYDRDNSLLASLFISGLTDNVVTLNIYPGVLRSGEISPGIWLSVNRDSQLIGGITTMWAPGIAFTQK